MENLSFDKLPEAVTQLYNKVSNIERLLLEKSNEPQPEEDQLLTVPQAAKFLSLSVPTIYSKISRGELPVMKRSKRCYFLKSALMQYLQEGRRLTLSEIKSEAQQFTIKKGKGGNNG